MIPEWTPPPALADPFVACLIPADDDGKWRARWVTLIRGRLPGLTEHAVAHTLATYGNKDGTRCRPGTKRLAADLSCSTDTIKRALGWLDESGWIRRVNRQQSGRGHAAEFRLTIPAPIAAALDQWPVDRPQWIERPADVPLRVTLNRGHLRTPSRQNEGGHPRTPSGPKGVHEAEKGVQTSPIKGCTGAPPPGSTSPGHLSPFGEVPSPRHADARRSDNTPRIRDLIDGLDPDDLDVAEELQERLEEAGYMIDDEVQFTSMIGNGQPLARVVAITTAGQRRPA